MESSAHGTGGNAIVALLLWLTLAGMLSVYLVAAVRQRRLARGWSGWRIASFVAGIVMLALAVSPPLTALAHHDLRGHMVHHLLLGMLAPLALVLAAPVTLALRTLPVHAGRRVSALLRSRPLHVIAHPVTALVLNVGGMYLFYLTPLYAATLTSPLLHGLVHLHFLAAGYLFAWAIAGPDPSPRRPGMRTRLAVLFIAMAAHSTLAKLMYAYAWPRGTPHGLDQIRAAAQLMYYGGDLAELLLAIALFATWYRASGRRYERLRSLRASGEVVTATPARYASHTYTRMRRGGVRNRTPPEEMGL
ncbi:MAG TPA: cytochrome c oxidase assembly protein [Longimicrobiaceae bacterium]|nr:cytochrome c oxidase assembly protein [Longimicrobiaceae bacterium]